MSGIADRVRKAAAALALAVVLVTCPLGQAALVDFEDLTLAPESYYNGFDSVPNDGAGENHPFTSRGVSFPNFHWTDQYQGWPFDMWEGWGYSNTTDTTTRGFGNQMSAITGSGAGGSAIYAVAYLGEYTDDAYRTIDYLDGAYFTNTTYAYWSMREGDMIPGQIFAKRFGYRDNNDDGDYDDPGDNQGDYPDWFKLIVTGLDAGGQPIAASPVEFYLADFRFADNNLDYIVDDWTWVDFSSLAGAARLRFELDSSDRHSIFGINTPMYFAMDYTASAEQVPEPSTLLLSGLGLGLWAGAGAAGCLLRRARWPRPAA